MFRRKKTEEQPEAPPAIETSESALVAETAAPTSEAIAAEPATDTAAETAAVDHSEPAAADKTSKKRRGNRVQKVGTVSSDKMQKTVVVRVDRLVLHPKYRRYVRRTSKFMAHDDLGSTTGDRVRIVETRPLSANKRWRVVEIVQKAAK
ncbi:MAG TPA: 30S ribosomal protein S17 [Pyrinomonadaceae bacterium]|nr:30S ribosomal protein S17 [Pyrinomonadaceae bacterium]